MSMSVRLSVRISRKLHGWNSPIFCACCLWPWLGPRAIHYVLLVLCFHTMGSIGRTMKKLCLDKVCWEMLPYQLDIRQQRCLVEFVRMWHQGRSLLSKDALFCLYLIDACCLAIPTFLLLQSPHSLLLVPGLPTYRYILCHCCFWIVISGSGLLSTCSKCSCHCFFLCFLFGILICKLAVFCPVMNLDSSTTTATSAHAAFSPAMSFFLFASFLHLLSFWLSYAQVTKQVLFSVTEFSHWLDVQVVC